MRGHGKGKAEGLYLPHQSIWFTKQGLLLLSRLFSIQLKCQTNVPSTFQQVPQGGRSQLLNKIMPLEYRSNPSDYREKEQLYLEVRRREGRVPTDEALLQLPRVKTPAALAKEWRWRKRSLERLDIYLKKQYGQQPIRLLDLGCGNGWMSNILASQPEREVWATDLNEMELLQGSRVFQKENLRFVYADVFRNTLPEQYFDVIVLAASVQYFPDLKQLLAVLRTLLKSKGSIHILDAHFYPDEKARIAAQQRTLAYYQQAGVPKMASFYYHHLWEEARTEGAKNLNERADISLLQRFGFFGPFPWLVFKG